MSCDDALWLLDACLDGELDLVKTLEVESHLQVCHACSREQEERLALRSAIRDAASSLYHSAPDRLRQRILRSVRAESPAAAIPVSHRPGFHAALAAASLAALVFLVLGAFGLLRHSSAEAAQDLLIREIVSSHVRSLMATHLTDVAASDRHTVKPWFSGRLDFSPPVLDLADQGFPLVGGRLDELADRPVAALVYQHGKHRINLFLWPAAPGEPAAPEVITRRGYHVLHGNLSEMSFWAVSDMGEDELRDFVRRLRQSDASGALPVRQGSGKSTER